MAEKDCLARARDCPCLPRHHYIMHKTGIHRRRGLLGRRQAEHHRRAQWRPHGLSRKRAVIMVVALNTVWRRLNAANDGSSPVVNLRLMGVFACRGRR